MALSMERFRNGVKLTRMCMCGTSNLEKDRGDMAIYHFCAHDNAASGLRCTEPTQSETIVQPRS